MVFVRAVQNAGAVIGKGGANIKRLRQDVGDAVWFTEIILHMC